MSNYIDKKGAALLTLDEVKKAVRGKLEQMIKNGWSSGKARTDARRILKALDAPQDERNPLEEVWRFNRFCTELQEINEALFVGRGVFAVCEKNPRRLDAGRHYYTVYYISDEGKQERVWGYSEALASIGGFDHFPSKRDVPCWCFSSRAIGMSRLLDATDGYFCLLRNIGGCYAQIDVL